MVDIHYGKQWLFANKHSEIVLLKKHASLSAHKVDMVISKQLLIYIYIFIMLVTNVSFLLDSTQSNKGP